MFPGGRVRCFVALTFFVCFSAPASSQTEASASEQIADLQRYCQDTHGATAVHRFDAVDNRFLCSIRRTDGFGMRDIEFTARDACQALDETTEYRIEGNTITCISPSSDQAPATAASQPALRPFVSDKPVHVGNWSVQINDNVAGLIEGEISFTERGSNGWFRSSVGQDSGVFNKLEPDGAKLYGYIYGIGLFPEGTSNQRHMNVTFSGDGLSASGTVHWGDDIQGKVTMQRMVPALEASVCCGDRHYGSESVKDGVIVNPAPGLNAIWVEFKGTGLPRNRWPAYFDISIDEPGLEFWREARNDDGTWWAAFWIKPGLTPGRKTITLNGVDIPLDVLIKQPDGSVVGGEEVSRPKVLAITLIAAEPPFDAVSAVSVGQRLRVRLTIDRDADGENVAANVGSGENVLSIKAICGAAPENNPRICLSPIFGLRDEN